MLRSKPSQANVADAGWIRMERVLFASFIVLHVFLLWKAWNLGVGFDTDSHVQMISWIRFTKINPDIYGTFYGYHPPLAFLIARLFYLAGVPVVASIQLTSALAMFVSFLFVRSTLKKLGLLYAPASVAFLYLTYALPINVFLSYSVNMDSVIFACAGGVLYFSVTLLSLGEKPIVGFRPIASFLLLAISMAAGLMTKFSGLVLLAIPFLTYFFLPADALRLRKFWMPASAVSFAVLIVLPYYYVHYERNYGTWFPSNNDHFDSAQTNAARASLDKDPAGFLIDLFKPGKAQPQQRDLDQPRLFDTWKDVWIRDQWLGPPPPLTLPIGKWYLAVSPSLLLLGFILFLLGKKDLWHRCGWLFLGFGILLIFALISYIFQFPWGGCLANKGIYIAPATWAIGYLLAGYFRYVPTTFKAQLLLCSLVLGFMFVNITIPVY